jgi:hypothetical protein
VSVSLGHDQAGCYERGSGAADRSRVHSRLVGERLLRWVAAAGVGVVVPAETRQQRVL